MSLGLRRAVFVAGRLCAAASVRQRWAFALLAAVMMCVAAPRVAYAQFGGLAEKAKAKAIQTLMDGAMKEIEKKIAESVAKHPISEEAKADITKRLTEMARPMVKKFIDGAASGKLPNPTELAQTVLKDILPQIPGLVAAAKSAQPTAPAQRQTPQPEMRARQTAKDTLSAPAPAEDNGVVGSSGNKAVSVSIKDTLNAPAPVADKGAVGSGDKAVSVSIKDTLSAPVAYKDSVLEPEAAPNRPRTWSPGDSTDKEIAAEMVFIKGGTFKMGCAAEQDADCYSNEMPSRSVTLSDFYIGKYEVTQKQWMAVMGDNPSIRRGDSLPVENVSGYDVKIFIDRLNEMTATGNKYRLPTEAEWEYAARGGAGSKNYAYSGGGNINDVARYVGNGDGKTERVGSKAPNEFGIYDMSGNVWELVGDWYGNYDASPLTDPAGPLWGNSRLMRGGGWSSDARACRVSHRMSLSHDFKSGDMGFRLAVGTQELKPATMAQTFSALQPQRPAAGPVSVSGKASAPAPAPSMGSLGRRESGLDYGYKQPVNGVSVGIGGFYGGDYGGGLSWASGEELAMPYGGAGPYLFFDAVYAEVFAGYSIGGGKWESRNAGNANNLPEMSRTYLNFGVLLKYPLAGGLFFPLVGVDYGASVSGKLRYENGNEYEFNIKEWRHDAYALSALWFKLGCGLDIDIVRNTYLRFETMYGFRTANTFEKYDASTNNRAETRTGHGLTCRIGAGFKFAK